MVPHNNISTKEKNGKIDLKVSQGCHAAAIESQYIALVQVWAQGVNFELTPPS